MKLSADVVRFDLAGIPVLGNLASGAIVGLTDCGALLCDEMSKREVFASEVGPDCVDLLSYLDSNGFLEPDRNTGSYAASIGCASVSSSSFHGGQIRLSSAYIHVSNACNLACVGCYSAGNARNLESDPAFKDLCRALDLLAWLGVCHLVVSGGEPFMRSDLPELVRHAREVGIESVSILTNGTCCSENALMALSPYVDEIAVSFDGLSAQSDAHVRKVQLFDCLSECVAAIQRAGIHAQVLVTVHAYNVIDIPGYLELGARLNASVGFSILSGASSRLGDLALDDGRLVELASTMAKLSQSGAPVALNDAFSPSNGLAACASCGAGRTGVSIGSDGSVYPCHMLHGSEFCLGNSFIDDFALIESSLVDFSLPSVDKIESCSSCEKRYLCGGGCRARAYYENGDLRGRDPYCAYYRSAIKHAVDIFLEQVDLGNG